MAFSNANMPRPNCPKTVPDPSTTMSPRPFDVASIPWLLLSPIVFACRLSALTFPFAVMLMLPFWDVRLTAGLLP